MLLAMGAVSPFASAFARKYGKRPVFVTSSVIGLVGCLVAEFAKNYSTLVAGRLLQGFGASAYESLCMSVVADIYFVHQRGFYVALVVFFLTSLSNGVSILAGLITTNLGWPYNFHILLPFVALQTIMVFLFVPETTYNRPAIFNTDRLGSSLDVAKTDEKASQAGHVEISKCNTDGQGCSDNRESQLSDVPKPSSFWKQLAIYNGVFTDKSLFSMVVASFLIMANLIASYNILVSGLIMAWFVAMSVLAGIMFAAPPWGFDAAAVGYVSAGPLVGGTLATVFLTLVSDPMIRFLTRRNRGVYEPEFRLLLTGVGGVFSVVGLAGFGHAIQDQRSIYGISAIWGLTLFGMSVVASTTMAYALDSHSAHAVEIFIMNITFKNFFFYGQVDRAISLAFYHAYCSLASRTLLLIGLLRRVRLECLTSLVASPRSWSYSQSPCMCTGSDIDTIGVIRICLSRWAWTMIPLRHTPPAERRLCEPEIVAPPSELKRGVLVRLDSSCSCSKL